MRVSHPATTTGASAFSSTVSSSPALYQSKTMPVLSSSSRRHSELPSSNPFDPSYHQGFRRTSNPYDTPNSDYSMAPNHTIPSISGLSQSTVPSNAGIASGANLMPQYSSNASRYLINHDDLSVDKLLTGVQITKPIRSAHIRTNIPSHIFRTTSIRD